MATPVPTAGGHAEKAINRHRAHDEGTLPFGPPGIVAVIVKVRIVEKLNRFIPVVLLRNVDPRAMTDTHSRPDVFKAESEALLVSLGTKTQISVHTHGETPRVTLTV